MTAAELIKTLEAIPPDTQIRVCADYYVCSKATTAELVLIRKADLDKNTCDTIDEECEPDQFEPSEHTHIFEIRAP